MRKRPDISQYLPLCNCEEGWSYKLADNWRTAQTALDKLKKSGHVELIAPTTYRATELGKQILANGRHPKAAAAVELIHAPNGSGGSLCSPSRVPGVGAVTCKLCIRFGAKVPKVTTVSKSGRVKITKKGTEQ